MKYQITYAEEVTLYGHVEIEAHSPEEVVIAAKQYDYTNVQTESRLEHPILQRIEYIDNDDGAEVSCDIPLSSDLYIPDISKIQRVYRMVEMLLESENMTLCSDAGAVLEEISAIIYNLDRKRMKQADDKRQTQMQFSGREV